MRLKGKSAVTTMVCIVAVAAMIAGCTGISTTFSPRRDKGDDLVEKLRLGMTPAEVGAAIGNPGDSSFLGKDASIWYYYSTTDRFPYDILSRVPDNARFWRYEYRVSSNNSRFLRLFFNEKDQYLIGWMQDHSEFSRQKFIHERLTSQLRPQFGSRRGMSHAKVYELIGKPQEIIDMPPQTRAIYEDHYWSKGPYTEPIHHLEVYQYEYAPGKNRKVFLGYFNNDQLILWGYDHAWEEAERYLAEQAAKKKSQ